MKTKPLPDKLSDLIRVAVGDLNKVLADDHYVFDADAWHSPPSEKCRVGLAGAVIAKSFEASPDEQIRPDFLEREKECKIIAIDLVQNGVILGALRYAGADLLEKTIPEKFVARRQPPKEARELPEWLSAIADELSAAGL